MASSGTDEAAQSTRYTLTRAEVAARCGISVSSVRRLEWDRLHPVLDERGVHRFDVAEVDALDVSRRVAAPAKASRLRSDARRGRLAADVFSMFSRRMTLPQIVVATKQPPEVIRKLYREWSVGLEDGEWERRDRIQR